MKLDSKSSVKRIQDGFASKSNQKVSTSSDAKKKSQKGKVTSPYFGHKIASDEVEAMEGQKGHEKKKEKVSSESKPVKRKANNKNETKNSKDERETKLGNKVSTPSRSAKRKRKAVNYKETGDDVYKDDASSDADPGYRDDADSANSNADSDDDSSDFDDDFIETPKSLSSKLSQKLKKTTNKSCMPSVERGYARKLVTTIDNDEKFEKTSKPVKRRKSLNTIRSSPTVKVISSDSDSPNGKDVVDEAYRSIYGMFSFWFLLLLSQTIIVALFFHVCSLAIFSNLFFVYRAWNPAFKIFAQALKETYFTQRYIPPMSALTSCSIYRMPLIFPSFIFSACVL